VSFFDADQLQAYLRLSNDDSWDDVTIIAASARQAVEDRCGAVDIRDVSELMTSAALTYGPVIELLSVSRDGAALSVADYRVGRGDVLAALSGSSVAGLTVTYRVGRNPVPEWAGMAARIIARHLWRTQRPSRAGSDEQTSGFAIPNAAASLMAPHATFGIA